MSGINEQIRDHTRAALKAGDKTRLGVLRMISAEIKQREIDDRRGLTDDEIVGILRKMIKQRRDAADQFREGNRPDLVERELAEVEILQPYLPAPLGPDALAALIRTAIEETDARSMKDMGRVMAVIKSRVAGQAEMSEVSAQVRAALSR